MRLTQTHVCPVFRYFDAIAPSTAASRSASSNTMNGALPPSSSDSFFTVAAHCAISTLPTSVDPVNDSFATIGLDVSSPPISAADPVTTLKTPFGMPARSAELRQRQRRERRLRRGLQHDRAAGGDRRAGLARDHRQREVPRRDARDDADRLLDDDDALVGLVAGNRVAVDALGFLAEPFEERRRVGDLAARLGERLPLLDRHQPRQVLLVRHHQVEPAAQDRARAPCAVFFRHSGNARSAASIASRVSAAPSFGTVPTISPVAGLSTSIVAPPRAFDPGAVDVAGLAEKFGIGQRERR